MSRRRLDGGQGPEQRRLGVEPVAAFVERLQGDDRSKAAQFAAAVGDRRAVGAVADDDRAAAATARVRAVQLLEEPDTGKGVEGEEEQEPGVLEKTAGRSPGSSVDIC